MATESISDDEISLTSTVGSDQASEYEVDTILAETDDHYEDLPPGTKYLVKWLGYPLDRCTWEPEVSFNQPDSLRDWKEKKQQISTGELAAFDVVAWEQDVFQKKKEKDDRQARRAAKRQRLASSKESGSSAPLRNAPRVQRTSPDKRVNASSSRRSGPYRSIFADQIHPARQNLTRPAIPTKPPPVSFGMKPPDPKPKRVLNDTSEPQKVYTLSWRYKFEKGRNRQPEPNIDQLDLRRPSEWDSAPSAKTAPSGIFHDNSPIERDSGFVFSSPRHSRTYQQSPIMSTGLNEGSPWESASPQQSQANAKNSRDPSIVKNVEPRADFGQPDPEHPPREPCSHTAIRNGNRSPPGEFRLHVPRRIRTARSKTFRTLPRNRWWNPGEIYVQLYFGPDKVGLGEARICGIDYYEGKGIVKLKSQKTMKIEIWLRDLCSLKEYETLCYGVPNRKFANGWIEGFDDTEEKIRRASKQLWQGDQIAIAHINEYETLLAYPPESRDFNFLDDCESRPAGYLNLALRSALGPIDRLWSNDESSGSRPEEGNLTGSNIALKDNQRDFTGVNASGNLKPRRSSNVTQQSESQPTVTPRPRLKPLNTAVSAPAASPPSISSPATEIPDKNSIFQQQNSLSTDHMELDPGPTRAPTSDHIGAITATSTSTAALSSPVISSAIGNSTMQGESTLATDPMDVDVRPTPASTPSHAELKRATPSVTLNDLFHDKFGITYQKLASVDKKAQTEPIFYVWFPDDSKVAASEKELILEFLHKHTSFLFSTSVDVHWTRFVNTVRKKTMPGVVLFHESFIDYEKIPSLKELLHKSASFWNISLTKPLQHVDKPIHIQRLFPHGGVLLLTEDFMVREPCATVIILEWFNWWARKKFPGNWKIMLRPGILDWLVKQIEQGDEDNIRWWLAIHCVLDKIGFSATDDLLPTLEVDPIHSLVISPPFLPNYGSRTADDSPGIPKTCSQEQRDTDHLGEFFAGWSLANAHRFRRFFMLTALEPLDRWKNWQHVQLDYPAFFRDQAADFRAFHAHLFKGTSVPIPSLFESIHQPQRQRTPKPGGTSTPTSGPEQRSQSFSKNSSRHAYGQGYQ